MFDREDWLSIATNDFFMSTKILKVPPRYQNFVDFTHSMDIWASLMNHSLGDFDFFPSSEIVIYIPFFREQMYNYCFFGNSKAETICCPLHTSRIPYLS